MDPVLTTLQRKHPAAAPVFMLAAEAAPGTRTRVLLTINDSPAGAHRVA